MTIICIAIILIYLMLIVAFNYGFDKVENFMLNDLESKTKFSIIIPFRDEAKNLPQLLASITKLNYPNALFEIIFVDDASTDKSVATIEAFSKKHQSITITTLQNKRTSPSPKKDAITTAITQVNYNWILTTDADCILPEYWLDTFDEFIQTHRPNCVVGPVTYNGNSSFFNRFQTLDFLSLQGVTIGSFGLQHAFMCNGANFAYQKAIFKTVEGFKDNSNIASGDDVFLLQKFLNHDAKKVHYLKSNKAIVTTKPTENFDQLLQQRLRWASKTSAYSSTFSKLTAIVVFASNLLCLACIPMVIFNLISLRVTMALLVIKFSIDFLLLFKTVRFFKQESLLFSYMFSSLIYPIFSTYIAITSLFKPYQWKGRTFKK